MINIYCDESCHLENDNSDVMVLGAISCNSSSKERIVKDIRNIKIKYNLNSRFEIKWTKVSKSKISFYKELIDYFFESNELSFRGVVALNKKKLNHQIYNNNDYDLWYYKMYYILLNPIIHEENKYKILIDIKDTHGGPRVMKLHEVLCNNIYDFKAEVINGVYQVNSRESEILQLADLMIGALGYNHRGLLTEGTNEGKKSIIEYIQSRYKIDMNKKTDRSEKKYNLFIWSAEGWR